jgi:hypothetical protein
VPVAIYLSFPSFALILPPTDFLSMSFPSTIADEGESQGQSTITETFGLDFGYHDDAISVLSSAPSGLLTPTVGSNPGDNGMAALFLVEAICRLNTPLT